MKINRSMLIAIVLLLAMGGWFWYNSAGEPERKAPAKIETQEKALPTVVTRMVSAEPHAATIKLFGRSETSREVLVKAETAGSIISTPVAEGSRVRRGTIICRQDVNARQAMLDQAHAQLKSRQVDYEAAKKLVERGFASETQVLSAQAGLDAARAAVKQAEIELDNINIRAPFSGVYEKQIAELGDYLGPGQPCGQLIELDPLTIAIDLTENQLGMISIGQDAQIEMATGESVTGKVKLIESRANPTTRTFRAEISVPNKDLALKAGVTATVKLYGQDIQAHLVPGHILGLNTEGQIGIKYIDGDTVYFTAVETIDETSGGIWVTGLPSRAEIIVQGQDYVADGAKAEKTSETR